MPCHSQTLSTQNPQLTQFMKTTNWLIIVPAIAICTLAANGPAMAQATGYAQTPNSYGRFGEALQSKKTVPGGPVISYPSDPLMTGHQEQQLLDALHREYRFSWGRKTSVSEIADDLRELFPVLVDQRAIEEIGLDVRIAADSPLWFSKVESQTEGQEKDPKRWWRPAQQALSIRRPSIAVDLISRLRVLDLTLMIRHGHVVITTEYAAEEDLATRIYDVTPLLGPGKSPDDLQRVSVMIETTIDCDTWESLGGSSTINLLQVRERSWLVVSAMTITHWKIQRLLDRLNQ